MKRRIAVLFTIMMLSLACACGQGDEQTEESDTNQEAGGDAGTEEVGETGEEAEETDGTGDAGADDANPSSEDNQQQEEENQKGTRSNPYAFTDEITIEAQDPYANDVVAKYTILLSELWGSEKLATEYPNTLTVDRVMARGQVLVDCDATDDKINIGLRPVFITSSLNEDDAYIGTYDSDDLVNLLDEVYSGGTYDVTITSSEGSGSSDFAYLKLEYTDADGSEANVWIELPEAEGEDGQISSDNQISDVNGDTDNGESVVQENYTPEDLDALLIEQPMFVESTNYIVQDENYKSLYPDILQAVLKNNSESDIKSAMVAFVAWDENNLPVKIYNSGVDIDGAYVKLCNYDNINVVAGGSFDEESGYSIDANKCSITTFKAIVVSYEDYDGNTWENPYYDAWVALYSEKRLE